MAAIVTASRTWEPRHHSAAETEPAPQRELGEALSFAPRPAMATVQVDPHSMTLPALQSPDVLYPLLPRIVPEVVHVQRTVFEAKQAQIRFVLVGPLDGVPVCCDRGV